MFKKLLSTLALTTLSISYSSAQCTVVANALNGGPACSGASLCFQGLATGGTPPYTFMWSGPVGWSSAMMNPCIVNVQWFNVGQYTLIVTDANGCTDTAYTTLGTVNPSPTTVATNNGPICSGDTAFLLGTPTSGIPPYTYTWSQGGTDTLVAIPNVSINDTGIYVFTLTDANGCTDTAHTYLAVNQTPAAPGVTSNINICLNELYVLTATGTNLLWYSTQIGGTGVPTMTAMTSAPGAITYYVSQTVGSCESSRSQIVTWVLTCDSIWPGDVNYDLVADNNDALDLALAYGQTGGLRTGASNNWIGQYCFNWNFTQTNNINMKHADCNGDGTVDANDTTAISLNYGQTHLKGVHTPQGKSSANPDLYFDITGISFVAGTTVTIPIKLGTTAMPMNNIMGIAADVKVTGITLTTAPIISNTISWIGNSINTMNFTKGVNANRTDWTLARIDHSNVSGDGTIATLTMDIPAGSAGQDAVLYFDDVKIIDNAGNVITNVNIVDDTASITPVNVNATATNIQYAAIVPNPSEGKATLEISLAKATAIAVTVTDVTGRSVWSSKLPAKIAHQLSLPSAEIAPGMYTIQIRDEKGAVAQSLKWIKK